MNEIVKHIQNTNASFRSIGAGDAKNTDLFLDSEHYELFKGLGDTVKVRLDKTNLSKAILFIASILPRKYDRSSVHKEIGYSKAFVIDELQKLDGFFTESNKPVERKIITWKVRQGVLMKNGGVDDRFYLTGLISDYTYIDAKGSRQNAKFTIRDYLAGEYSDIHFKKAEQNILDVWITNALEPTDGNSEKEVENVRHVSVDESLSPSSLTPYLTAIRTKPFLLLAGISGTGKSRLVRKLAQATTTPELEGLSAGELEAARFGLHKPANFELVQVKPNWHNSMDVVGYASNIPEPHYVFTPFVEFVAKAFLHEEVPFFLCLDEMNLAPVEEYFAEFLSAIESRSLAGGSYETDPIIKPFWTFGEDVCEAMLGHLLPGYSPKDVRLAGGKAGERVRELSERFRTRGLTLPKNLIVVGTVNMDETTFSFSRKVLDRAMSFEMNEVDYDAFVEGRTDDDLLRLAEGFGEGGLNELLVDRELDALEVLEALDEGDSAFVVGYLKRLNALLDGTPFKLGYRAANEALLYLAASKAFGVRSREAAMDEFTMMKVLSRLEGDEGKLRLSASGPDRARLSAAGIEPSEAEGFGSLSLLTALSALIGKALGGAPKAAGAAVEGEEGGSETGPEPASSQSKKLRSLEKLKQMASALDRDNFVSYWT